MEHQLQAYEELVRAAIAFCAALFKLVTGHKAPESKRILR